MDFFGNVQEVEVEAGSSVNNTEHSVKEDLVAIAKLVEQWKEMEKEHLENTTDPSSVGQKKPTLPSQTGSPIHKLAGPMKVRDADDWSKHIIGLSLLFGIGGVWFAGSLRGRS